MTARLLSGSISTIRIAMLNDLPAFSHPLSVTDSTYRLYMVVVLGRVPQVVVVLMATFSWSPHMLAIYTR
jgi:hypothetical protein